MSTTLDTVTTPLAMPGAGPQMRMLAVASIASSPTNPRKTFNTEKLQELAASIKTSGGVHQPILVRPLPAARLEDTFTNRTGKQALPEYELVAGERRWRASQIAGVDEIPAMIRDLTDEQAHEVQIIENLQREDVSELEEAEGYEFLMQHSGLNADQVAEKIGKSRSYVYGRLKVLTLCIAGRNALRDGKLDFSKALLAARIPNEQMQLKALEFMTRENWNGDLPGYRECVSHVQHEFMLRLDAARFEITDALLLPAAGNCTDCVKRTGANPDMYYDVDSADMCTDPKCFHEKTDAQTERMVLEAQEKGQTVIVGKEAEELATQGYNSKIKGYRRLDSAEDSPTNEPLRKIIGKQMKAEGIEPVKIENPRKKGELLDALPNETVLRLLKVVEGQAQASKEVAKEVRAFADEKKAKAESKAKGLYEQAWRNDLVDRTWRVISTENPNAFTTDIHRYLAIRMVKNLSTDDVHALADILGLGRVGAHSALVDFAKETPSPDFLQLLCIMQTDSRANDHSYGGRIANEGLMLVAGAVFQDRMAVVINHAQVDAANKYLPKPQPDQSAAPEGASTPSPAAPASGKGAKGRAQKRPAAPASSMKKTTAAEALAGISAAMQAADATAGEPEPGAAVAAQGDEGAPVADAQAPIPGAAAAAQGNDAGPVAAGAAQDLPPSSTAVDVEQADAPSVQQSAHAQTASADDGQARADAGTGAADEAAASQWSPAIGDLVRVKQGLKGSTGRPRKDCGRVGVVRMSSSVSILVEFGPGAGQRAGFDADEIEPYTADPIVGKRARVLASSSPNQWQEGMVLACKPDGWEVEFPAKRGTVAKKAFFETAELESIK